MSFSEFGENEKNTRMINQYKHLYFNIEVLIKILKKKLIIVIIVY